MDNDCFPRTLKFEMSSLGPTGLEERRGGPPTPSPQGRGVGGGLAG
jgi:hypothetical protein